MSALINRLNATYPAAYCLQSPDSKEACPENGLLAQCWKDHHDIKARTTVGTGCMPDWVTWKQVKWDKAGTSIQPACQTSGFVKSAAGTRNQKKGAEASQAGRACICKACDGSAA